MDFFYLILLGLVQGVTEFLPVSSSAHLVLIPYLLGVEDHGLAIDVAAHMGTLCAVIFYFRRPLQDMLYGGFAARFRITDERSRLFWHLVIATLPVAVTGLLAGGLVETHLRGPLVIAGSTIVFGLLLWWSDSRDRQLRSERELELREILIIGLFQALALVPGTSRSGIVITAGLLLGMDRKSASRFSFLLSIPVILLAGGYEGYKLVISPAGGTDWLPFLVVLAVSAVTAWLTIHLFLAFLYRTGLRPYIIYRLLLGALLLYFFV